ncbi:ABC-F type ribosomal protection protein [Ruminococcaceae bacterium OttesenSCG-928-A16]|nr:ABC-F type ribosomal protection protein [Ruminococcaceae bacterium OttesenSCG-928-A16]
MKMSVIQIKNLSFSYPGALQPVFNNVTLNLDTSWRLGLVGRNGRGKTTFLRLLLGQLQGRGQIISAQKFDYFPAKINDTEQPALTVCRAIIAPFDAWEQQMQALTATATPKAMEEYGDIEHAYATAGGYTINEAIEAEAGKLGVEGQALLRPFKTLSGGEQVKLMLAAIFLKKHHFLLIDEPTDHLDTEGRTIVAKWLSGKSGFILVSHDRDFLDQAVDHILSINRNDIELQKGNYSSWHANRTLQDNFELAENEKLQKNINRLKVAAKQTERWSDKVEKSKYGSMLKDDAPAGLDRGYIGHQAAKMMKRSKSIERRQAKEIEEQQTLLKNIEQAEPLKFMALKAPKPTLLLAEDLTFGYGGPPILNNLNFAIKAGDRIAVTGQNGSGKTSLVKLVEGLYMPTGGRLQKPGQLIISTLPQNTSFLQGDLQEFVASQKIDPSLFLALLRKLNFERETFNQPMQRYSAGQKKKVCLAASLAKPAHLFVWDEPLNYIDILSREQIEQAIESSQPTMLFVEHDAAFVNNIATGYIQL